MQDLSSPTRDRTHAPCTGSVESTTGLPGKSLVLHFYKKNNPSFFFFYGLCFYALYLKILSPTQWFLTRGDSVPRNIGQCLDTFLVVMTCGAWCYWSLMGKGWGCYYISYNAQQSFHDKELSGPKCQWCCCSETPI